MRTLIALPYSPWSEKARWALDIQAVAYREETYQPLFGALNLRRRTGRWRGKVQVPVLLTDDGATFDSFEIAKLADRLTDKPPLVPPGLEDRIETFNDRAEEALAAGRALLMHHIDADRQAQMDYVPALIPKPVRPLLGPPIARAGLALFSRKYRVKDESADSHHATLAAVVKDLAEALSDNRDTLLDQFTFADIAMAAALQVVQPISNQHIRVSKRSMHCWANPDIADAFPEVLTWRDNLYAKYRLGRI